MKKTTVILLSNKTGTMKSFQLPIYAIILSVLLGALFFSAVGYIAYDYSTVKLFKHNYYSILDENIRIKNEAKLLVNNAEKTEHALMQLDYLSNKIQEASRQKINSLGAGLISESKIKNKSITVHKKKDIFPGGINFNNFTFKKSFLQLTTLRSLAHTETLRLRQILSTLSEDQALLSCVPSLKPVNGWYSSTFGYRISPFTKRKKMHKGVDIAAAKGSTIYAPADGVVLYEGLNGGYGKFIVLAHGFGIITRYGHNSANLVKLGDKVKRGQKIATVGSTGKSTGSHLHYEIWVNGKARNPLEFIKTTKQIKYSKNTPAH